jgi:hypothetical protein
MRTKIRAYCIFFVSLLMAFLMSQSMMAQASSTVGGRSGAAFRMGSTARGMAMGNAMSAVVTGQLAGSENPAVVPFQQSLNGTISYSLLSLDRRLNLLTFGQPLKPNAGISFQILNAGVGNIDIRDNDGLKSGTTSTSENSFVLSFGLRPDTNLAIGISTKIYYHSLYEKVFSTSVGFNIGFLYRAAEGLAFSGALLDLNSKYRWDSRSLWGKSGASVTEKFPKRSVLGASYVLSSMDLLFAAQYETAGTASVVKMGAEWQMHDLFALRFGVDNISFSRELVARPSFGFILRQPQGGWTPGIEYAFVLEPYSPSSIHVLGISVSIP